MEELIAAQAAAPEAEQTKWTGKAYSTLPVGDNTVVIRNGCVVVPKGARELQSRLLSMAHDHDAHYGGAARTYHALRVQARVWWEDMEASVRKHVGSCFRCTFAKPHSHKKSKVGTLNPTMPLEPDHTWFIDLKGPMPHASGHLMSCVDGFTRHTRLRYLRTATAAEVIEELEEIFGLMGTQPAVIRTDGGPAFAAHEFAAWCDKMGILHEVGSPHHSQAQGLVETRFRSLAAAIMATMGHKAPYDWANSSFMNKLERVINSTYCESLRGSPYWARFGVHPRTPLAANVDTITDTFLETQLDSRALTADDFNNILCEHHDRMQRVHERVRLSVCVAQAVTKQQWDQTHDLSSFKRGQEVLVLRPAPNRLLPHFVGPYTITELSSDGNFVALTHFLDPEYNMPNVHVSRLLPFNGQRATKAELVDFQLEPGSYVVTKVLEHRQLEDRTYEFHLQWHGTSITSWTPAHTVARVNIVNEYCTAHGLPQPDATTTRRDTERRRVPKPATESSAAATAAPVRHTHTRKAPRRPRRPLGKGGVRQGAASPAITAGTQIPPAGTGPPARTHTPSQRKQLARNTVGKRPTRSSVSK
jgi:hypothetical protein